MSAHPSPDGSLVGPGTEGQGTTAGEVLAMRMIQAAESAATAAQAATQAVAAITAGSVGGQLDKQQQAGMVQSVAKAFDIRAEGP